MINSKTEHARARVCLFSCKFPQLIVFVLFLVPDSDCICCGCNCSTFRQSLLSLLQECDVFFFFVNELPYLLCGSVVPRVIRSTENLIRRRKAN